MGFNRLIVFCLFGLSGVVSAERYVELGFALAGQNLRDYRGSSESQTQAFPLPVVVFQSDFLKVDRGSMKGEFLKNDSLEINLSGEFALNGDSDDNQLREGMPELDTVFELGPSFNINLTGDSFDSGWSLRLPLRGAVTVGDDGVDYIGAIFNPKMTYRIPNFRDYWKTRIDIGVLYSSSRYHQYFYDVSEEFVTPNRPFFESSSGYSGTFFRVGISRRENNFWYGLNFRYDFLDGAVFDESPLVETNSYIAVSFAMGWFFWSSK